MMINQINYLYMNDPTKKKILNLFEKPDKSYYAIKHNNHH